MLTDDSEKAVWPYTCLAAYGHQYVICSPGWTMWREREKEVGRVCSSGKTGHIAHCRFTLCVRTLYCFNVKKCGPS